MAFLWKAMGFGDSIPEFPFTADSKIAPTTITTALLCWTCRAGTRDEDSHPVSIFSFSLAGVDEGTRALARRALKRSKSIMLPGVLRCYGGTEYQEVVYIATEVCVPLTSVIDSKERQAYYYGASSELFAEGVAQGLQSTGEAISALGKNTLIHGNVCAESVYVTASGFWRLWGLELVDTAAATPSAFASPRIPEYRRPPSASGNSLRSENLPELDSWGMACLIFETMGPRHGQEPLTRRMSTVTAADIRNLKQLPRSLQSGYNRLCSANAKMRPSMDEFIEKTEFIAKSEYVNTLKEFEQLSLKDVSAREHLMGHIASVADTFPLRACLCVVLPKLTVELGLGTAPSNVVEPIMAIARIVKDDDDFQRVVGPAVVALFQSPDRALRQRLLHHAEVYGQRLSETVLCEQVWPLYAKGFSSAVPTIREYSARSLVHLAPRLTTTIMGQEVPKLLQHLQQDADGTIRTNATICLCLVSDWIPAEQRSKVLVVGFGRMLRDPFAQSRLAALQSFNATMAHILTKQLADMVIPGVAPLALDPDAGVRETALSILHKAIGRLEQEHTLLATSSSSSAAPVVVAPSPTASASASDAGWTGWVGGWGSSSSPLAASTASDTPKHATQHQQHAEISINTPASSQPQHHRPARADPMSGLHHTVVPASTKKQAAATVGLAVPLSAAASKGSALQLSATKSSDGWDEDEDDGWGSDGDVKPTASVVSTKPPVTVKTTSAPSVSVSLTDTATCSGDDSKPRAMKLRKKGGLGASRMD